MCYPVKQAARDKGKRTPGISRFISEKPHCEASSVQFTSTNYEPLDAGLATKNSKGCSLGVWITVSGLVLIASGFIYSHKNEPSSPKLKSFYLPELPEGIHNLNCNFNSLSPPQQNHHESFVTLLSTKCMIGMISTGFYRGRLRVPSQRTGLRVDN